ncbi:hypothetical protein GEMRC1_002052 [Eukaryota sp. GEM-RC1]
MLTPICKLSEGENITVGGMITYLSAVRQTKSGKSCLSFVLKDSNSAIRCTIWGDAATEMSLSQRSFIVISKVRVKAKQSHTNYVDTLSNVPYEIHLNDDSVINISNADLFAIPHPIMCNLSSVHNYIGQTIHVIGLVVAIYPVEQITTQKGTQTLKISARINDESTSIVISGWGTFQASQIESLSKKSSG